MSLDELIRAWQAGELDADDLSDAESDATGWDYYDSSITDPIDELERAALASIHGQPVTFQVSHTSTGNVTGSQT